MVLLVRQELRRFLVAAASLRGLHRGHYHRDLNLKNIVVRRESDGMKGYIIDFDRAKLFWERFHDPGARNLDRLLRSANKLDPKREYLAAKDWKSFVDSYHERNAGKP